MTVKNIIILALMAYILSACTGMHENFGCNATASNRCTPVSKVNAKAESGFYDNKQADSTTIQSDNQPYSQAMGTGYEANMPMVGRLVRGGERVQRIWIAPYQDLSNNYHEPSYVYTVLNSSHWIGSPVKEVDNQDD